MVSKGLMRSGAHSCHSARDSHIELLTAPAAHAGCHKPGAGHSAPDVAERVHEAPCRRPGATCMVIDAPRLSGAPAWRTRERSRGQGRSGARRCRSAQGGQVTRGRRSARGQSGACYARAAGVARSTPAGGKMRGVECGRRGDDSGRAGGLGLSRGESLRSLSDLHLASECNYPRTKSNTFKFMAT